jgi:kynurenine formamidase
VSVQSVDQLIADLSNWGRWGMDDQAGTLNLITPEHRQRAAGLIQRGDVFSLAIDIGPGFPQTGTGDRLNAQHFMTHLPSGGANGSADDLSDGADDAVLMWTHGATHWDALSHVCLRGKMYNGYDSQLVQAGGALRNDIAQLRDNVVTRGILADVARAQGEQSLGLDQEITASDLKRALDFGNVQMQSGDALLIRTGRLGTVLANSEWGTFVDATEPGIGLDALRVIREHDIAAVATDTWAVEVLPSRHPLPFPVHAIGIVHMGLLLGEIFALDALAAACAEDGRYEFFFAAQPLPLIGAVGSPVNPLAIK